MNSHDPVKLITFQISHFCEKARWALDWHNIAYREIGWPPGLHILLAKRAGAKRPSVPILIAGENIIKGSSAIIDWAERNSDAQCPSLTPSGLPAGPISRHIEPGYRRLVRSATHALGARAVHSASPLRAQSETS